MAVGCTRANVPFTTVFALIMTVPSRISTAPVAYALSAPGTFTVNVPFALKLVSSTPDERTRTTLMDCAPDGSVRLNPTNSIAPSVCNSRSEPNSLLAPTGTTDVPVPLKLASKVPSACSRASR